MRKNLFTLLLCGIVFVLTQMSANAMGFFYTNTDYPITATGANVENLRDLKKGTSSCSNVLFLVEMGDAGIDTAAKNGGIKKISHIDVNEKSIFIFWRKLTVTVYGE